MATPGTGAAAAPSKTSAPARPKFGLELKSDIGLNGEIQIRIRTDKDGIPSPLAILIFRNGVQVAACSSDNNGFYSYNEAVALGKAQSIKFEIFLRTSTERAEVTVNLPEKVVAISKPDDPQKIVLIRMHDGAGNFRVFVRVLKTAGYGLKNRLDILCQNQRYSITTDARGIAIWNVPFLVDPGEDFNVQAVVNGIEDHARLRIRRFNDPINRPRRFSAAWFFRTNNGRAFMLMCLAAFFWCWALLIGIGQPMIHDNIFRGENNLSQQEMLSNRIMTQAYGSEAPQFLPVESPGHWHHMIWKVALILTLIFFIYGPLSLREEIAEEVGQFVERMMDREYAQAGDPWFEKLVAWSGAYAVSRNKAVPTVTAQASTATASTGEAAATAANPATPSMWSEFPVHLASDAIIGLLGALSRSIVR